LNNTGLRPSVISTESQTLVIAKMIIVDNQSAVISVGTIEMLNVMTTLKSPEMSVRETVSRVTMMSCGSTEMTIGKIRNKIRKMMIGRGFRKLRIRKGIKRHVSRSKQNRTCIKAAAMKLWWWRDVQSDEISDLLLCFD
jgi:hypothetical protein